MRLPGAFRRLPRPSSALKPSHSPDGVICRAVGGVYWRLVKTFISYRMCASLLFVRGVILNPLCLRFGSPFTPCSCEHGVACFDGLAYFAKAVLEADSQFISVSSFGIRVANVGCVVSGSGGLAGFGWVWCTVVRFLSIAPLFIV